PSCQGRFPGLMLSFSISNASGPLDRVFSGPIYAQSEYNKNLSEDDAMTGQASLGPEARLPFTPEVAAATAETYERVKHVVPQIEWRFFAPYVDAINRLKREKNAVILAHNYMTPEIFHAVADFMGDSLQLAQEAARTDAKVIVQGGVHFMAETSKILSPDKTVLIPDLEAGCSLAASITGADVRLLRQKY